jgi:hypothetical protein
MVDTHALGACAVRCGGSSPLSRTKLEFTDASASFFIANLIKVLFNIHSPGCKSVTAQQIALGLTRTISLVRNGYNYKLLNIY